MVTKASRLEYLNIVGKWEEGDVRVEDPVHYKGFHGEDRSRDAPEYIKIRR